MTSYIRWGILLSAFHFDLIISKPRRGREKKKHSTPDLKKPRGGEIKKKEEKNRGGWMKGRKSEGRGEEEDKNSIAGIWGVQFHIRGDWEMNLHKSKDVAKTRESVHFISLNTTEWIISEWMSKLMQKYCIHRSAVNSFFKINKYLNGQVKSGHNTKQPFA